MISKGVFQALHFATVELSAFYFDIRKDALYCDAQDSATGGGRPADGAGISCSSG